MTTSGHKTDGETLTQNAWVTPSSCTGKERDEETGYSYFGARYMDHALLTMWLSVDPMSDKYPSISPYAYCAWNPVKLVDPDGKENVIYLVNLQGKKTRADVNAIAKEANRCFSALGLQTRVVVSSEGECFNPAYMDNTDSYVVIGSHADVKAFMKAHAASSGYEKYFKDWKGGATNPERSSFSLDVKTNAIGIDANGLEKCANELKENITTMGAFLILHGAGHNATLGHPDCLPTDEHYSRLENTSIMASGSRVYRSGRALDYFMDSQRNSSYKEQMIEKFGNRPAVDHYYKNKANTFNKYDNCPQY